MVVAAPTAQLAERRRQVRRFWRSKPAKREQATQRGFAAALKTSTTAINDFENRHRDTFPKRPDRPIQPDYERYLERLEAEVEREKAKAGR